MEGVAGVGNLHTQLLQSTFGGGDWPILIR